MATRNSNGPLERLRAELGDTPPRGVARLDGAQLEHLTALIRQARRRQAAELEAAGERGISFVPRLLRGPLRKVLGA